MVDVSNKVLEQSRLFLGLLPALLEKHRGKWVVFHDGAVHSEHDTEEKAYLAALDAFGSDAGFVIMPVVEPLATPITAGVMFGLGR